MDLVALHTTCEIFPDQGLNSCLLHWEADSYPLHHQGSPEAYFLGFKHIHCALSQEIFAVGQARLWFPWHISAIQWHGLRTAGPTQSSSVELLWHMSKTCKIDLNTRACGSGRMVPELNENLCNFLPISLPHLTLSNVNLSGTSYVKQSLWGIVR